MTIILRMFHMDDIRDNSLILILGMFKSGKSFATKDILFHFNDIPMGKVISEVSRNQLTYSYIPPIFIDDKYERHSIKKFLKRQDSLISNEEYDSRAFIILENCLHTHNFNRDKYFQQLVQSNKAYNYMCIIEADNVTGINDNFKNNIDFLFILKDNFDINRLRIYDQFKAFLGIEYTIFTKLMDDYTDNYNFLVLNLKCNSKCIEDKLFWYKASKHDNFKMCSKESWEYNDKNYIKQPPERTLNRSIFY